MRKEESVRVDENVMKYFLADEERKEIMIAARPIFQRCFENFKKEDLTKMHTLDVEGNRLFHFIEGEENGEYTELSQSFDKITMLMYMEEEEDSIIIYLEMLEMQ